MDEIEHAPTPDDLFWIVSHPVRRWLLKTLPADTAVPIELLARQLAATGGVEDRLEPRQALIVLRHVHLPPLEQLGLVETDDATRAVSLNPTAATLLEPALDELDATYSAVEADTATDSVIDGTF